MVLIARTNTAISAKYIRGGNRFPSLSYKQKTPRFGVRVADTIKRYNCAQVRELFGSRVVHTALIGCVAKMGGMTHTERNMVAAALNRDKYTNALLYFIAECGNEHLGITKLNKLFYYLDFISHRDRGQSVTGETYVRLPKGPFAESLEEKILQPAQTKKLIERKQEKSELYGIRNRFHALAKYDLSVFDEYERELLSLLCSEFRDWNTDQMIAQTHSEAPWVFSRAGKPLDYNEADDIELLSDNKIPA